MPLVRSAHECETPTAMALNRPAGAVACPWWFKPQQVMVPLVRSAHEWLPPAATAEYRCADWDSAWGAVTVRVELASQRLAPVVVGKKRTLGSWRSPQVLSVWRCWRPNSMRPSVSLRATMRTSPAGRSSDELASQRLTVAVVGKKRTRGSWRSPQVLSVWRCWRPNSMRPVSSLRATMRTSTSPAGSWPAAGEATTALPRTARRAEAARQTRRFGSTGPLVLVVAGAADVIVSRRTRIWAPPLRPALNASACIPPR